MFAAADKYLRSITSTTTVLPVFEKSGIPGKLENSKTEIGDALGLLIRRAQAVSGLPAPLSA
jgi:hypothetical protein